jgi:ParB family chromosome partitioning protein
VAHCPHAIVPIDEIVIGESHRKDLGDVRALAESIDTVGLLHLPVVNVRGELIAGRRRLEAVRLLGWKQVPVTVATNLDDELLALRAEADENCCRKDLTLTEAVSIGLAIEKLLEPISRPHGGNLAAGGAR